MFEEIPIRENLFECQKSLFKLYSKTFEKDFNYCLYI